MHEHEAWQEAYGVRRWVYEWFGLDNIASQELTFQGKIHNNLEFSLSFGCC